MRTLITLFFIGSIVLFSCKKENVKEPAPQLPRPVKEIEGILEGHTTLYEDTIYVMTDWVRVPDGSVLTIQPGTVIKGCSKTKAILIVQKGAKIMAEGTERKPIVFTSNKEAHMRMPGDWGGVVICGKAKTSTFPLESILIGIDNKPYGGEADEDNSGIIRFVRIEYAGAPLFPSYSYSSITLAGVGSGTKIEYLACLYGLDRGIAFDGGTVNARFLISYSNSFESFHIGNGFRGSLQYLLGIGSRVGIHIWGNIEDDKLINTFPNISNVTLVGSYLSPNTNVPYPEYLNGVHVKSNGKVKLYNTFIAGFTHGIYINDRKAAGQALLEGQTEMKGVILAGIENWGQNGYGNAYNSYRDRANGLPFSGHSGSVGSALKWDAGFLGAEGSSVNPQQLEPFVKWFETPDFKNKSLAKIQEAGLNSENFFKFPPILLFNKTSILLNSSNSVVLPSELSYLEKKRFIGAFEAKDWTKGWVNWDPQQTVYE